MSARNGNAPFPEVTIRAKTADKGMIGSVLGFRKVRTVDFVKNRTNISLNSDKQVRYNDPIVSGVRRKF